MPRPGSRDTLVTRRCQDSLEHEGGGQERREDRGAAPPACQLGHTPTQLRRDLVPHPRGESQEGQREVKRHSSASASNPGERGLSAWVAHKGPQTGGQRFTHLTLQLKQHTQKQDEDGAAEERRKGPGWGADRRDGTRSAEGGQRDLKQVLLPGGPLTCGGQRTAGHQEYNKRGIAIESKHRETSMCLFPLVRFVLL